MDERRLERLALARVAGIDVAFAHGERIWTESSCKYEPSQVDAMRTAAGFVTAERWVDDDARFALTLFAVGR